MIQLQKAVNELKNIWNWCYWLSGLYERHTHAPLPSVCKFMVFFSFPVYCYHLSVVLLLAGGYWTKEQW